MGCRIERCHPGGDQWCHRVTCPTRKVNVPRPHPEMILLGGSWLGKRRHELSDAAPNRTRPTLGEARPRPWGRGLQLQGHPHLAAAPEHRPHHPRTGRSGPQPGPAQQPRRTPAGLRPTPLQAAQHRRTPIQPSQAMARHRCPHDKTTEPYQAAATPASILTWA